MRATVLGAVGDRYANRHAGRQGGGDQNGYHHQSGDDPLACSCNGDDVHGDQMKMRSADGCVATSTQLTTSATIPVIDVASAP